MESKHRSSEFKVILVLIFFGFFLSGSQILTAEKVKKRSTLELSFIANEGVMVSSGKSKVLIDALFDKPHPNYNAPTDEILEKMLKGKPPFNGINLVLATHNHADHFEPSVNAEFMENHPESILIAPIDAVTALKENSKNWEKIQSRVISLDLEVGETSQKNISGITVKAYRTLHSGDRGSPDNLMYLIEIEGWHILHEGDSDGKPETFIKFGLGKETIDLALVHFWFPLSPGGAKILQEILKPEHIGLIHLPIRLENDAPGKIDMVRKYYKDIFLLLPGFKPRIFTQ